MVICTKHSKLPSCAKNSFNTYRVSGIQEGKVTKLKFLGNSVSPFFAYHPTKSVLFVVVVVVVDQVCYKLGCC